MNKWLIKKLILEKCDGDKPKKRLLCGRLSGAVGVTLNVSLGLLKILVGIFSGSIAITADAVNNLSDAMASILTMVGFSLANKKSDAEHPFGHARYEYMTGVLVSVLVIVIGVQLVITAFKEVMDPTPIDGGTVMIALLVILIFVKLWMYFFNIQLSKLISSSALKATGIDSRNDAIVTASTMGVILLGKFAGVNIDGYIGLAVGAFVIYSGLIMVKETTGPLLGQSPDPKTVKKIVDLILGYKGVLGIHDLIVHDYGPGHILASVHIEVDAKEDIFKSHELVDDIENKVQKELRIMLVGHMDPVDTQNPRLAEINEALECSLCKFENVKSIHDLRIVTGPVLSKVILDVVVSYNDPEYTFKEVEKVAQETLDKIDSKYIVIINRDFDMNNL